MHTVTVLDEALAAASHLGYSLRHDVFGGLGGGLCEVKGQRLLFLDLEQTPDEQLAEVVSALQRDRRLAALPLSKPLRALLGV